MIVTEADAATRRCCGPSECGWPGDSSVQLGVVGDNDVHAFLRKCIGSACMAWKWASESHDIVAPDNTTIHRGYCGYAGG